MKHDGRKSRELCERGMNMISFTASCGQCMGLSPDAFTARACNYDMEGLSVQLAGTVLFIAAQRNEAAPAQGCF